MTMNKMYFEISGGAKVHSSRTKRKIPRLIALVMVALLIGSSSAFAQGSIYGSVTNSNATTPANGEISFIGYLDNTDEEIRIETCVGAGYDAGNWFDDFQNYLTEAPGNPYDYHFHNTANGEGAVLSKTIPSNSFQEEDIVLAAVDWPGKPTDLAGRPVSSSSLILSWTTEAGLTYHVYRRAATSSGSFFRIDAPGGSLTNPGVANGFFVDNTVNGTSSYTYLIIAQDASGNFGPHSDILTTSSATLEAPLVTTINPTSGPAVGNTPVAITGTGFDMNGVAVTIGGVSLTSIAVVSPYEITGITQAGIIGLADVVVTNTASALSSAPLTNGFEYLANSAPVLAEIGSQTAVEGTTLNFTVSATDPDGTIPTLSTSTLPGTATFVDNGDGTGTFNWGTVFTDAGDYQVTFTASDGSETDSEPVDISITEAGNQLPVLTEIGAQTIAENSTLSFNISATDPDGDIPTLSATDIPLNADFTDNLDGTGTFNFTPDFTQAGTFLVTFKAFDGVEVDSEVVQIDVTNTNRLPILATIGAQSTDEDVNLNFVVSATDDDGETLTFLTSELPAGAVFTDNLDGTGTFDWTPAFDQDGAYVVTFYVTDQIDTVFEDVNITVNDAGNQAPVLDPIGPLAVSEGGELIQNVTSSDPDATIPQLFAESLPNNAVFLDNGDGTGTLTFNPDYTQAGVYTVLFYATDGSLDDSEEVEITVSSAGNQAPVLVAFNDTTIAEGDSLVLVVSATDPDGTDVIFSASSSVDSFSFVDSGNGIGVFSYYATYYDAGSDSIWISVFDTETPPAVATEAIELVITDVNQPPVIDSIGPFGVAIEDNLTFTVTASDPTDPNSLHRVFLSGVGLPTGATFIDNGNSTGTFSFTPTETQVGTYTVTFIARDEGTPQLTSSFNVGITVVMENRPPSITVGTAYTVWEGDTLEILVTATDLDGNIPALSVTSMPAENAFFVDSLTGAGVFTFMPSYVQAGLYNIVVRAYDGIAMVKKNVLIQVYEAGNQPPVVNPTEDQTVTEGDTLIFNVTASDPDASIPTLTADSLPINATFVDNGDGTGTITFLPVYVQAGTYNIYIIADDGEYSDTSIVTIIVEDAGNQMPVLIEPTVAAVEENTLLTFTITSTDPDSTIPYLSAASDDMPDGATFTDNRDYTGTFSWQTDYFDAGNYIVRFIATDFDNAAMADTIYVALVVNNVNQLPRFGYIMDVSPDIDEMETYTLNLIAIDPDSTIPSIVISPNFELVDNMTFVDNGNGTAVFTFTPDYTQGSTVGTKYYMRWRALDAEDPTFYDATEQVTITVYNINQPPVISIQLADQTILTGDTLEFTMSEGENLSFQVNSTDGDGTTPILVANNLPTNATFTGVLIFSKTFRFIPDYTQAGDYYVTFIATDGLLSDTTVAAITVQEAGNQAPVFSSSIATTQTMAVGTTYINRLNADDPDLDDIVITMDPVITNVTFVDSGNGAATCWFTPDVSQAGSNFAVAYIATDDAGLADTIVTNFNVVVALRGDANSDTNLNMLDIVYIINYLYKAGPSPTTNISADSNYDGAINIMDATYLVNYFYRQGPPPPQ